MIVLKIAFKILGYTVFFVIVFWLFAFGTIPPFM